MTNYTLYIDESGKNNLRKVDQTKPLFSMAGVIVGTDSQIKLENQADQLKYKYWGLKHDICFHANEMRRHSGQYSIFDPAINPVLTIDMFHKDLTDFINNAPIKICFASVNKLNYLNAHPNIQNAISKAGNNRSSNWNNVIVAAQIDILKITTDEIMVMYLQFLIKKNGKGNIVFEATGGPEDGIVFKVYQDLMSKGCKQLSLTGPDVRKYITGISFVTKHNFDIEIQITDLAAYYLGKDFLVQAGIETILSNSFEDKIIKRFKNKSFNYENCTTKITQNTIMLIV